ncbi:YdeI/OmpD-associated family protein [Vallicoccus soli]|uniref:DUF1905 domain-containing protein n=1 Tax=Vallicoccus soli TaxID=2339232 RepID=A0A3A3ZD62_9ACTN|nr:YdeI/OmpD-associated family protein [Vallicoccus soli]RJK92966.1 DUF1905 domain-containing protein [Vallicoccus soli]
MTTTFTAVVELGGRTATGIPVPPEALDALGGGRRPAVRVVVGDYAYRSTVGSRGGRAMLPLSAEHRAGAGVAAGDAVEVRLELDTAPREVALPDDLAAALDAEPAARAYFDGLPPSARKHHVTQVEGATSPETRARRVERSLAALREGRPR